MKNYNVDWSKTIENICFMLFDRTHKKNLSEVFNLDERQVQRKLSASTKKGLSISELLVLADYLGCDLMDLIVMEGETYIKPNLDWDKELKNREVQDKSKEEVNSSLEVSRAIKDSYEIRNLCELLLYIPLIEEEDLRDVVCRCFDNLEYNHRDYVMKQMSYLYKRIPDCPAKQGADNYRDNVLRVKGHPKNNMYGFYDKDFNKHYYKNLERYFKEGNSKLYAGERQKKWLEARESRKRSMNDGKA